MGGRQCKILFSYFAKLVSSFSSAKVSYLGFQTAFLRKKKIFQIIKCVHGDLFSDTIWDSFLPKKVIFIAELQA